MRKTYTWGDVLSIAEITAFLYAGALQHPAKGIANGKGADFEHWEGHTGFVMYCATYAEAIDKWLDARELETHPGVLLYELIEPMGEWMIGLDAPLETTEMLEHFKTEFLHWINKED